MKSTRVPPAVYNDVAATDAYRCVWCWLRYGDGRPKGLEFHHRLPRSRARNLHDRTNGVMLCTEHHAEAHATARWPYWVPGSTLRGVYVGPDPIYHMRYNGAAQPSLEALAEEFPNSSHLERRWALQRAQHALALGL